MTLSARNRPFRIALLSLALLSLVGAAPPPANADEALSLYADATVIDGTGAPPRAHQDILVRGQRIVAVAPHGTIAQAEGRSASTCRDAS
ncbi:hypothetical protein ACFSTI_09490 [Rhizorhabdus histidinilytica]